jgi:hypothetical protein
MSNRNCPVCGAHWFDGQLYWSGTGKPGKDEDLNALVCRRLTPEKAEGCVNPKKGCEGGIGWEERMGMVEAVLSEFNL